MCRSLRDRFAALRLMSWSKGRFISTNFSLQIPDPGSLTARTSDLLATVPLPQQYWHRFGCRQQPVGHDRQHRSVGRTICCIGGPIGAGRVSRFEQWRVLSQQQQRHPGHHRRLKHNAHGGRALAQRRRCDVGRGRHCVAALHQSEVAGPGMRSCQHDGVEPYRGRDHRRHLCTELEGVDG